jgi:hypothetical protein
MFSRNLSLVIPDERSDDPGPMPETCQNAHEIR